MERNANRFWRTPGGRRPALDRRLGRLAAAVAVVTGMDLLVYGRPHPTSYVITLVVFVVVGRLLDGQEQAAGWGANRRWPSPVRLSPGRAWVVIGLGVLVLALAVAGALAAEGAERAINAGLLISAGLSNLAWGAGSLLPEGRRARAARGATLPLGVALLLAVVAWVALQASARL
jgi:hypothetical protein